MVAQAYRFALDPTARQVGALLRHAGAARVAYNWALAQVKAILSQREAEKSYGVEDLTPSFGWSMYSLRKAWNQVKGEVAPWWAECSKEAYATGLEQLARPDVAPRRPDAVIGVDLGVKTLAVFSDGRPPAVNPRHYDHARKKLRRLSRTVSRRTGPDRRTGAQPSKRWLHANDQRNKVHHRVADLRSDGIHKLTTELALHTHGTSRDDRRIM